MQVNINNQTSFGMKSINPVNLPRGMEKLFDKAKPEVMQIGHVATHCSVIKGSGIRKIIVLAHLGPDPQGNSLIGRAIGRVFSKKGLLKLVQRASNELNQMFIDFKLPANPSKKDLDFSPFDSFVSDEGSIAEGLKSAATPTRTKVLN